MLEKELQTQIISYIRKRNIFGFAIHNEFMGLSHLKNKFTYINSLKTQGFVTGATDLVILYNTTAYFVELKVNKNKLSDKQQEFKKNIDTHTEQGYKIKHVVVRDTLDDFIEKVINDQS